MRGDVHLEHFPSMTGKALMMNFLPVARLNTVRLWHEGKARPSNIEPWRFIELFSSSCHSPAAPLPFTKVKAIRMLTDSNIIQADLPARASVARAENDHEKIGIARIKLHHSHLQLTAVLAGFVEVDRRLTTWNKQADVPAQCEFEVTFTDGKLIRGSYQLWRSGRGRTSLCNFIRTCLLQAHSPIPGDDKRMTGTIADQYGNIVDAAILNNYEIERSADEFSRPRQLGGK